MEKVWMKHWPQDLPQKIKFTQGEIPIHGYLRFQAKKIPDKPALIFYGRTISYEELNTASDRFAAYLLSQGIKKGDRVGIFLLNCPQYVIAHFGIQKIGAIVCPALLFLKNLSLSMNSRMQE